MRAINALTAAIEHGGWDRAQDDGVTDAEVWAYFSVSNFRNMFPGDDASECGGYTLRECAEAVIRWHREAING